MPDKKLSVPQRTVRVVIALIPWVLAMYLYYWLESTGAWNSETPHRGKLSVAILATGMALSFLAHSFLNRNKR